MESTIFTLSEPKQLYRRMEAALTAIDRKEPAIRQAQKLCSALWAHLSEVLQIKSIQCFDCLGDVPEEICFAGDRNGEFPNEILEIFNLMLRGAVDLPYVNERSEIISVVIHSGIDPAILLRFIIECPQNRIPQAHVSQTVSAFSALQYATAQHAKNLELQDALEQARAIQMSLLPPGRFRFHDFDIAAVSVPARTVGGDIYDFEVLDDSKVAIVLADASGHGLPAALQARDVIIGLRMGRHCSSENHELIQRLNRVIHNSGLASRFISLVYATLHKDGTFSYVNAGHPGPILFSDPDFQELESTGMILGPNLNSHYREGSIVIPPAGSLVMFSDGIPEHTSRSGIEFGVQQIKVWMEESIELSAPAALIDLIARLRKHGNEKTFQDDISAIFVKRSTLSDNLQF